ncbi:MAG: putative concanavalin A-like lectin/glucanases superfamily protein [Prokaryotic dsDNA virus sp.]|nr:MAG: putative concanavalin A-like lectin/glucanases superfamily protein [Prokaryotic dsDNA virus sp.]|tara:strand:- start:1466 stop:2143 length:678 start_codon:yes stop_codon:yes gene_type:complete
MAIVFDSSDADGSDYYEKSSPSITDYPITMACWVKPDSISDWDGLIAIGKSGVANHFIGLSLKTDATVRALSRAAGGAKDSGVGSYTAGNWHHAAGVWASDSSRIAYLDGTAGTEETTARQPSGINRLVIGEWAGNQGRPLDGFIAEVAIWNVALTASEIAILADGFTANQVRPHSLISYYPMVRDYIDVMGNNLVTPNNTVVYGDHTRIIEDTSMPIRGAWGGI